VTSHIVRVILCHSMARVTMLGLLLAFALVASVCSKPAELFDAPRPFSARDGAATPSGKDIPWGEFVCACMCFYALHSTDASVRITTFQMRVCFGPSCSEHRVNSVFCLLIFQGTASLLSIFAWMGRPGVANPRCDSW
jgi:hypothetical protein